MAGIAKPHRLPLNLAEFDLSPEGGFLPRVDPLPDLAPPACAEFNRLVSELPKLLSARRVRETVTRLDDILPDAGDRWSEDEDRCAGRALSFLGHAYVWEDPQRPERHLPGSLAIPWYRVMTRLGRPPVLSYASYCLDNWRRFDPRRPIELGNIALLTNFLGGMDEEWFVLVHVDIEAKAGRAMAGICEADEGVITDNRDQVVRGLEMIAGAVGRMAATLLRMPERCDPYVYYHRVRPYIHGWKDNPALPDGIVYDRVEDYHERPQRFRGETGAQSSIIPTLDAALGVVHAEGPLTHYLDEMREYMPPKHRTFIETLEARRDVQGRALLYGYCRDRRQQEPQLWAAFCECVRNLARFRDTHYGYADRYIHQQHQRSLSNPTEVGTGGTPFMRYLKEHLDETVRLIDA